ncbi:MAG: hypothetical protein K2X27_22875 [Candidatus Obscuribacterales bacterium]|nr:hypothetical protein [Candidatus Obscuribacterales bacterium]
MNHRLIACCLLLVAHFLSLSLNSAQSAGLPEAVSKAKLAQFTPVAQDIAQELGLLPLYQRLEILNEKTTVDTADELERLRILEKINSKLLYASLEVRDATARIERELAMINRLRGLLEDRRDRAIKLNSIENIAASGAISEIGNSAAFMVNQVPGQITQLVAGAATIGLGTWALKQQSGSANRHSLKANMLCQIFELPLDKDTIYPDLVWAYLKKTAVGAKETRKQELITRWQRFRVIPKDLKSPAAQRRIALLTNTGRDGSITISVFNDQSDMLFDLRAEIFQMDRDLLELMKVTKDF